MTSREAFEEARRAPFLGYLMVFEDCPAATSRRITRTRFFEVDPELKDTSFMKRYEELLRRLVRQQLYDATCLLPTTRDGQVGAVLGEDVALDQFLAKLVARAGYLALRPGWA